ncbi:MAG: substrate-binding domain-containing protein [Anaerolineae bacterium]|nr:substrate-binding domain-containing protein [Anaerolineae bacterium]
MGGRAHPPGGSPVAHAIAGATYRYARPTLALIVSELAPAYEEPLWTSVSAAAEAAGVNLLCFVGGQLAVHTTAPAVHTTAPASESLLASARNAIYEFVRPGIVDAAVVVTSSIGVGVPLDELQARVLQLTRRADEPRRVRGSLPVVSLGVALEGVPSVVADSVSGMREAVTHLVERHNCRRIAFIRSPEGQCTPEELRPGGHILLSAHERYDAYRQALENVGIALDPDLVVTEDSVSGVSPIVELLDHRGVNLDAIMVANDAMAFPVIEELRRRGLQVPQDVRVVGFDDMFESRFSVPSLTTVRQPLAAMGRQATEMALAMLRGETVESVKIPTNLTVRESCGCPPEQMVTADTMTRTVNTTAAAVHTTAADEIPRRLEASQREAVVRDAGLRILGESEPDGVVAALADGLPRIGVERALVVLYEDDAYLGGGASTSPSANGPTSLKATPPKGSDRARSATVVLAFLYPEDVSDQGLVVDDGTKHHRGAPSRRFDGAAFVPPEFLPSDRRFSFVVEPLTAAESRAGAGAGAGIHHRTHHRTHQRLLGYVLFEPGPLDGVSYDALRGYLSSALHAALFSESMRRRAEQLQATVEAVGSIRHCFGSALYGGSSEVDGGAAPDRLAQHIVDTLQRRLGVDFAGIFLVEEQGATYWTGTGEVGARMRADGLRLRIGGSSAVGQAALTQRAQFVSDQDLARADLGFPSGSSTGVGSRETVRDQQNGTSYPIRVGDRYLPDTRAELALPLLGRQGLLGVLSLRSTVPGAIRRSDIDGLQVLADQVAGAIENAEQLKESQAAVRELRAAQRRYQQQAWSDYLAAVRIPGYELGGNDDSPLPDETVAREVERALSEERPVVLGPDDDPDWAGTLHRAGTHHRDASALVVPINYSGAPIGALGIHDDASRSWTEDEVSLVTAVVERMGLAAENLRLLDETQRRVATERLTQAITARMRQTLDIGQVLQAAVRGFAEAFDAEEVAIRLTPPTDFGGTHHPCGQSARFGRQHGLSGEDEEL